MAAFEVPEVDYTQYSNRQLVFVPLLVLVLALGVLAGWYLATGAPVALGIDFTGGTELTVETDTPRGEIAGAFDAEPASIQAVSAPGAENRYIVTFEEGSGGSQALTGQAEANLDPKGGNDDVVQSQRDVSASFGQAAQQTTLLALAIAFAGMSVLAFVLFRTFVPSIAIVVSAFSDLVIPLAVMNLVGIELSLGVVAGLLMLIGYSVDSDILLNNHILRRRGDFYESAYRAMRTGVTMTITSIAAMSIMAITASIFQMELLSSIGFVLAVGLTADLMNTYLLNLSLLRIYRFGWGER